MEKLELENRKTRWPEISSGCAEMLENSFSGAPKEILKAREEVQGVRGMVVICYDTSVLPRPVHLCATQKSEKRERGGGGGGHLVP